MKIDISFIDDLIKSHIEGYEKDQYVSNEETYIRSETLITLQKAIKEFIESVNKL